MRARSSFSPSPPARSLFSRRTPLSPAPPAPGAPQARYARPLFVATIVTGSFLLFLTQPMIGRMALPRIGGAPAVWNSAMLVYQTLQPRGLALPQPMIGRMALPRIGGAPAVWNSAMLVYQTLLLGGYAYAHWVACLRP